MEEEGDGPFWMELKRPVRPKEVRRPWTREARLEMPGGVEDVLTGLLCTGAGELIHQAVEAKLDELLPAHAGQTDEQGRAAVVRNGHLPERGVLTGAGTVDVQVPNVRSRPAAPIRLPLAAGAALRAAVAALGPNGLRTPDLTIVQRGFKVWVPRRCRSGDDIIGVNCAI